jgi:type IV secretory pathway VirJ component
MSGTDSLKIDSIWNFKHQISVSYIDQIKNLPLVITKTNIDKPDAPVALLISGDGGWYSFEQSIANHLAEQGIPTVGLDSRKYFWNRKTPEVTTRDISKALEYYSKEWGRNRFLFVGYSLGAEIIPFIANRVSEDIRSRIVSSLLLSPETTTDFEIHISNMLGMGNSQNTYNVMDEIYRMQSIHTLVIFGEGEKTTVPELLSITSVKVRIIPGDHHYKSNVPLIMKTMKENKAF